MSNATCAQRVEANLESRLEDLQQLWDAYCDPDNDDYVEDLGSLYEYGLAFDYVAPGTFANQTEPYFRYQLSWGGPSDEFRFFVAHDLQTLYRAEYWFLDWGDGASVDVTGNVLVRDLWKDWFATDSRLQRFVDNEMSSYGSVFGVL